MIQTWGKRKAKDCNYTFKDLVLDLDPYTLLPKEDIAAMLKLAFILILINVKDNKVVNIPNFGRFQQKWREPVNAFDAISRKTFLREGRYYLSFAPFPFVRWFLGPDKKTSKIIYREAWYRVFWGKVKEYMIHHREKYDFNKIIPPWYSEKNRAEYEEMLKKNSRPFNGCK